MSEVQESKPSEVVENVQEANTGNKPAEAIENVQEANTEADSPDMKTIERGVRFASSENIVDEGGEEEEDEVLEVLSLNDDIEADLEEEHYVIESLLDSDESEEEELFAKIGPPPKREKLVKEPNFFEQLGRLPDIEKISLTESILLEIAIERGELIIPETIEEEAGEEEQEHEEILETVEPEEEVEQSTEYSEIDYDFESSEEETAAGAVKQISEEDPFEAMIREEREPAITFEEPDFELYARLQEARQVKRDALLFMRALIDAVVEVAEYVDPRQALRENLDKVKLFRKFITILEEIQVENKTNKFLHHKCVYYFKRLKSIRPITPETAEALPIELKKFNAAIAELDDLLGRETANKIIITKRTAVIEEEASEMEEKTKNEIAQLDSFIRKTFSKRGSDSLNTFVDRRLRDMSRLRQEISAVRNVLIQRQHTKARLLEKMANLENITDTLRLNDYERMLGEEYALQKKIEEKSDRLQMVRHRFHCNINVVAHMREKKIMLYKTIQMQAETLAEATMEKNNLREYIFKLESNHIRVKKQIREKSFQCGLIDKPALCIDYDFTMERTALLKEKVKQMKRDIQRMENRIRSFNKRQRRKRLV